MKRLLRTSQILSLIGVSSTLLSPASVLAAETALRLSTPTPNEQVGNPIVIEGSARGKEDLLHYRLRDANGVTLSEGSILPQGINTNTYGPFTVCVALPTGLQGSGVVDIYQANTSASALSTLIQVPFQVASAAELGETIPLYRLYQQSNSMHFYTSDLPQRETALQLKYRNEGTAGWLYQYSAADRLPLFHLFKASTKDHFYTSNITEKNTAITKYGYAFERIEGYVNTSSTLERMTLYRLYNPRTQRHFYTNSAPEANIAVQRYGYKYEGVAAFLPRR